MTKGPLRDSDYLRRVRALPCCKCGGKGGEAHHTTFGRGMAQKSPDRETMPLCWQCHYDFHSLTGPFKGWEKQQIREWQRLQVEATQLALDAVQ